MCDQTLSLSVSEGELRVKRAASVLRAMALATAHFDVAVLYALQKCGANGETGEGDGEAANLALVAVDAGSEVARGEGVGGVGEEGDGLRRGMISSRSSEMAYCRGVRSLLVVVLSASGCSRIKSSRTVESSWL